MNKFLFALLLFFLPNIVFAMGDVLDSGTIVEYGGNVYGLDSKESKCYYAIEKDGEYFAIDEVDNFFCYQKIEVLLDSCVDGDTAKFIINGEKSSFRFLAIDTEESVSTRKENTCMGEVASNYTCDVLENASKIEILYDEGSDIVDKYNRRLSWVFVDGELLQNKLVYEGYARVYYLYGDYKYTSLLLESEKHAKEHYLGIWDDNSLYSLFYKFIGFVRKIFTWF